MLDYELDSYLLSEKRFWKVDQIIKDTGLSLQEFMKSFETINLGLEKANAHLLELKNGVLAVPERLQNFEEIRFSVNPRELSICDRERSYLIYLLIFSEIEFLSIASFQENLAVSRNTVLADIKRLRNRLEGKSIRLENSRKKGFYLAGDELALRQFAWLAFQKLDPKMGYFILSRFLNQKSPLRLANSHQWLKKIFKELKIKQVQSRYLPVLFFSTLLLLRQEKHQLNALPQPHFVEIEGLSPNKYENEYFLALIIASSDGEFKHPSLDFLYRIGFQMMENVMKLAAIDFEDFTKTFLALLAHLTPAYFRLLYHFEIENVLLDRIKKEYRTLFDLVKKALEPLSNLTGPISESELAYFVILFGGEIYKHKYSKSLQALVLCINGISSSLIMRKRLESLFPSMEFVQASSVQQFEKIEPNSYDMIFSTIELPTSKKIYLMSPMPSREEEALLYNQVLQDFSLPGFMKATAQSIYKAIEPYITLKEPATKENLLTIIDKKLKNKSLETELAGLMLSDLIRKETIHFTDEALDWESAVRLAAKPLLDKAAIEKTYPEAIIKRVKEFGPYIDLGMGICLPHARPEDGVNQIGMSFLRCAKPVRLLDDPNHEVKLFILLAAVDNEAHLKALSELTGILSDKDELNRLLAAATIADVENILAQKEKNK